MYYILHTGLKKEHKRYHLITLGPLSTCMVIIEILLPTQTVCMNSSVVYR